MNGKYVVIGKVLARALPEEGLPMMNASYSKADLRKVRTEIVKHLNLKSDDAGLFVFTHWH